MLDPAIVDQAIQLYSDNEVDLVTNVQFRTFPKGQSVEIFSTELLSVALGKVLTPSEREHVTPYFYNHLDSYRIINFVYPSNRGDAQLSVDTQADLERFSRIIELLGPPFRKHGLQDLLSAYDEDRL
jgi:spore coat polysaccharide biosynthesis protein SpsF